MAIKNELTTEERLHAAYLHFNMGLEIGQIAAVFDGIDQDRIHEAITAIRLAAEDPKRAAMAVEL